MIAIWVEIDYLKQRIKSLEDEVRTLKQQIHSEEIPIEAESQNITVTTAN